MSSFRIFFISILGFFALNAAHGVISLDTTTGWTEIVYNTPTDYLADQQTGQPEADLVGQPGYSSFYKAYDYGALPGDISDDTIGFRLRVREDQNPPGFTKYAFIGIDANNDGSIDIFVGGNQADVGFHSPGLGLNTGPSTTTVDALTTEQYMGNPVTWSGFTTTNYSSVSTVDTSLNLVDPAPFDDPSHPDYVSDPLDPNYNLGSTTADLDGGAVEDFFFSFSVSMQTLAQAVWVATGLNANKTQFEPNLLSEMKFIAVTSTQANSFNQDLNGQDGDINFVNSTQTWEALGGTSNPYTADGNSPVPEPSAYAAILGLLCFAFTVLRRRY